MAVTLNFNRPTLYNLKTIEIGESATATGTLAVVETSGAIGVFPHYICEYIYASGDPDKFYGVRFTTDDGFFTPFTERMFGKEGSTLGYFILLPSGGDLTEVYLIPTTSPSFSGVVPSWLDQNTEYTVTVLASGVNNSGLYGSGTTFMEEDFVFQFTAQYCPLWSTTDLVRMRIGPIVDGIPDDTLNRIICTCSNQAANKFFRGRNPYGCAPDAVAEPVVRWVSCCAAIMALNAAIAGGQGARNTVKHLGDMTVRYGGDSSANLTDIRKDLNMCIAESEILIRALRGTAAISAVQSIANNKLVHPMADAAWGRMPRGVLQQDGNTGPWSESQDYFNYGRFRRSTPSGATG